MKENDPDQIDPRRLARIGGALYLVIIAIGMVGEAVIRGTIVVQGDAAAIAANLQSHETLWRVGIAAEFVLLICGTILTLVLYLLLRPVSGPLALLAVLFNLVTIAIEAVAALFLAAALLPLGSAAYLGTFQPDQLRAMATLAVTMHTSGFGAALIFFGVECVILGYLIYRSGFLPRTLGILMQIAGACYIVNCFAFVLAPGLASSLLPAILLPAFIGELSLCLWLLVKGVNADKWRSRAVQTLSGDCGAQLN